MASEACWRIFDFRINYHGPGVERLSFHLPDQQSIIFHDFANLLNVINQSHIKDTIFFEWMKMNQRYEDARALTYTEFLIYWVWHSNMKEWK